MVGSKFGHGWFKIPPQLGDLQKPHWVSGVHSEFLKRTGHAKSPEPHIASNRLKPLELCCPRQLPSPLL